MPPYQIGLSFAGPALIGLLAYLFFGGGRNPFRRGP